jgi:hypothetical protein
VEREDQASQRIADGCTLHGGEPFTAICRQCGTYMCKRCNEDGRFDACVNCRAQRAAQVAEAQHAGTGFPFRRDGVAWGPFLRFCLDRYAQNFGVLTLAMIACFGSFFVLYVIGAAFSFVSAGFGDSGFLWALLSIAQIVLTSALTVGMLKISLEVVQSRPVEVSMLWSGMPRLGAFLLVTAAMGAAMLGVEGVIALVFGLGFSLLETGDWTLGTLVLGALLALAAMGLSVYVSLGFVFACLEVVAEPTLGVLAALRNAWRIANGERLTVGFGLFLISLLMFAGMLMCGVGMVFTLGLSAVIFSALYLALRNGAPLLAGSAPSAPLSPPPADGR